MSKPDLFIVTSAILTNVGSIDPNTRFLQTLSTINSIKIANPNSVIIVTDGSLEPIPEYMINEINRSAVFADYSLDANIRTIHEKAIEYGKRCAVNYLILSSVEDSILKFAGGYIKNMSEIQLLSNVLNKINSSDFNRIFKVSGRYVLGSEFNRSLHTGLITTHESRPSNQLFEIVQSDRLVNCILWSFDSIYVDQIKSSLQIMSESIESSFSKGVPGPDIEHCLYSMFENRTEIKHLGILGMINVPNSTPEFYRT